MGPIDRLSKWFGDNNLTLNPLDVDWAKVFRGPILADCNVTVQNTLPPPGLVAKFAAYGSNPTGQPILALVAPQLSGDQVICAENELTQVPPSSLSTITQKCNLSGGQDNFALQLLSVPANGTVQMTTASGSTDIATETNPNAYSGASPISLSILTVGPGLSGVVTATASLNPYSVTTNTSGVDETTPSPVPTIPLIPQQ